ncbi:zinc/iron permease [Stenomitos frigidus ULC18]|uniref:Zinc/iron permease n=2 Tax=Stenomitos TaxID=1844270 RepID=A0A2T1E0Z0_9CYAN|nr:zinc/iron permease [Stenomitos frigidus ULC18]
MQVFFFAITLSALPVVSNFMGAMLAEALPLSKRTLGLALHAVAGVLLAIVATELIPNVMIAKPAWATILALFLGGAFFVWVNQLLNVSRNRLHGVDHNTVSWVIFLSMAIDLFGDGLMIGTSLTISPHLGVMLASARVVAHIPEGFVTNAEFKSQKMPRTERFLLLIAFIIPVWLGATLGYWGLRGQADLPKLIVLAFTTGTLLVAIVEEIIPEAHQTQDTNWSMLTFIGSFALSMLFSSYLE